MGPAVETSAETSAASSRDAADPGVRPLLRTEPGWGHGGHAPAGTGGDERAAAAGGNAPVAAGPGIVTPSPAGAVPYAGVPVAATRAAHAVVRIALEVVDGLRPPHRATGAFPPALVEVLTELARQGVPGRTLGNGRLHRVHVQAADPDAPHGAGAEYEVCATYARGPRLFAVAARVRLTRTGALCTALRLV